MALAFGQTIARASSAGNPTTTGSITIAINEKVVVLLLKVRGATARTGGTPTFGGTNMTQANSTQIAAASPEASAEIWYLLDPVAGANTIGIPNTAAQTMFYTIVTAKASSASNGYLTLDGANGSNATSTNPSPGAVTTTTENSIGFAITAGGWTTWAPSAQVGTIIANTDDGADGGGEQYIVITGPSSTTLSWTFGTSDDWGAVAVFFKEVTPSVLNNYQFAEATASNAGIISVTEKIR